MIEIWKCTLNISAEHRKSYYREGYLKKKLDCPKTGGGGGGGIWSGLFRATVWPQCDQQVQVVKLSNTTTISCPPPQDHKSTTQISNYKYTLTNVIFFTFQAVLPCCLIDYCLYSCCWKTSALPCPVLTRMIPPSHKEEGLLSFSSDYDWTCFVLVSIPWNTDLNTWPFRLFSQVDFTIQTTAVK